MGKSATPFKDIGKSCSDLLSKDFKVGKNTVEVKTKTANGVIFTPLATKSGDSVSGSLAAKYLFPFGVSAETTLTTAGTLATQLEGAVAKGMILTVDAETGKSAALASGKATLDYKKDMMTCKASYDYYKGEAAAAASGTYGAITVGGSLDYSVPKSAMTKYAAAAEFSAADYSVAAKLSEVLAKADSKTYECSYFHKVSPAMQVGTEVKMAKGKDVGLAFGCMYKVDKDTTVKSKVDADGILSASYKQKVSSMTTLTLAATVDTVNLNESSKHKFGMAVNITP
mmetsp:Transcript_17383/g.37394  ORF Transcript_17383/g.37394 Transcript_17383/m.37394 type:complete len:284 (+) Transcript_17383:25-876(+)